MSNPLADYFRQLAEGVALDPKTDKAFLADHPAADHIRARISSAVTNLEIAAEITDNPSLAFAPDAEPIAGRDLLAVAPGLRIGLVADTDLGDELAREAAAPVPIPLGLASLAVRRGEGDAWVFAADATGADWTADKKAAHRFATREAAYAVAQPFGGYPSPEL